MTIYTLSHGPLKLDVSDRGGVIEGFWRDATPLLRPGKKSGVATDASCFPLVPFANRVSGNRFRVTIVALSAVTVSKSWSLDSFPLIIPWEHARSVMAWVRAWCSQKKASFAIQNYR